MPALNFPSSPTTGQVFTGANKSWTYDGAKWIITQYDNAVDEDVTDYIDQQVASAKGLALVFSFLS